MEYIFVPYSCNKELKILKIDQPATIYNVPAQIKSTHFIVNHARVCNNEKYLLTIDNLCHLVRYISPLH